MVEHATISLEAEATHIPESVSVSVEGLEDGAQIHARDLVLPKGSSLITDPDALVVHITAPRGSSTAAGGDEAAAEGAAEAE